MKNIFRVIILIAFWFDSYKIDAQIKWEVADESINLTPEIFVFKGSIGVLVGSFRDNNIKEGVGEITIDINKKTIYLNDGNNIYQFKKDVINNIKIDGDKYFGKDQIFEKGFSDSLILNHRKILYGTLNLNRIEFSSSKRIQYEFNEQGFSLKNQKKSIGKICYVSPTSIIILYENGELDDFSDGDFNFLQVNAFKAFKCKSLYDFIYEDYINNLVKNIKKWEDEISKLNLDSLISLFGPFNDLINVSTIRKMFVWKKEEPIYHINLSTLNRSFVSTHSRSATNIFSYSHSSLYSFSYISPIFLSGNSYRTTSINTSNNSMGISTSQTTQSGKIEREDAGFSLTLIQDDANKTIKVLHKNIFSEPRYGIAFRFVSY